MTAQERLQSIVRDLEFIQYTVLRSLLEEDSNSYSDLQDLMNNVKHEAEMLLDELAYNPEDHAG